MTASEKYKGREFFGGPPKYTFAVTPSDTEELEAVAYALRVGTTAGDIKVTYANGKVDTIPQVQVGETVICGPVKLVWYTGTDADGITALTYG